MVADAVTLVIAYIMAYYLRFESGLKELPFFQIGKYSRYDSLQNYAKQLIFLIPLYLIIYYLLRLYRPKDKIKRWREIPTVILADILGIAFFLLFLYFAKSYNISRIFLLLFFIIHLLLDLGLRLILAYIHRASHNLTR